MKPCLKIAALAAAVVLCSLGEVSAATCYITEYRAITPAEPTGAQMAQAPPVAEQTVAIGGSHAESAAFNNATRFIRMHCDAVASFLIGTTPAATSSSARTPAGATEYFGVRAGDKISIITNN